MTLVKKAYPNADKRTAESLNVNWITYALPTEIQLRVQAKKFRTISEVVEEATYRLEVEKVRKVKKPTLAKNEVLQTANEVVSNSTSQTSEKRAAKEVSLVTLSHELKNTNKQINERISQIEKSQHPDQASRINQHQNSWAKYQQHRETRLDQNRGFNSNFSNNNRNRSTDNRISTSNFTKRPEHSEKREGYNKAGKSFDRSRGSFGRRCFICQSLDHILNECPYNQYPKGTSKNSEKTEETKSLNC
jgi:hypothetical protein